jgi:hypothetical protein
MRTSNGLSIAVERIIWHQFVEMTENLNICDLRLLLTADA